ncbi:MAG: hypothetical protein K6T88_12420 [Bacillus sp. (in: Bacteria)]|nr:hypothetical protein [Bacillus sp. (in: firmicutes)]
MHFRYFLISFGLMVGAAMFLPDHVFAEKTVHSGQQSSQKSSVKATTLVKTENVAVKPGVPAQAENVEALIKPAEVSKPAQAEAKQQSAKITLPQAASEKLAVTSQNFPDQAKGNGQSALKKTEKAVNPGTEKAAVVQEKYKPPTNNAAKHSLQQIDTEVENRSQPSRLDKKYGTEGEGSRLSVSKKEDRIETLVLDPQKMGQFPANKEKIPTVNQVMNPTERTNRSGGQSNDRVSNGLKTISLLDITFKWNKNYEVKFIRSYLSRQVLLNNQWVNAPSLPPPKEAPVLKTVNRS